jgi:UDP-glucose 4-epimerase
VIDCDFRDARVLITGGAGFIGSTLAIRLVQHGAHVTILDSLIPEYGGNLFNLQPVSEQVRLHITDVRNQHGLQHLLRDQDFLFNLAGQTSHMDSMTDPQTDLEINCRAQLSLLEVCRAVNNRVRLVYASTRQIYGKPDRLPVDETHPLRPVDGRRILPPAVLRRLWNSGDRTAADQHVRPADANSRCSPDIRRCLDSSAAGRTAV